MDTIYEYVKWRGDERFSYRPFCDTDALILTYLTYLDMKNAIREGSRKKLRDICKDLKKSSRAYTTLTVNGSTGESPLIDAIASSKRFGDLYVREFIDIFQPTNSIQFAAMVFDLDNHESLISFRGTDDSLAGWKEDFMLSYRMIPGQRMSFEYATNIINNDLKNNDTRTYYISGHSKGANLALYSAATLHNDMWQLIKHVYMFDGPGLCHDVMPTIDTAHIAGRTTHIRPSYSIIGGLFDPRIPDTRIVKSTNHDMLQHDMASWGIKYGDFDYADRYEIRSVWITQGINIWVKNADMTSREKLVNEMFDALASSGYRRLKDLSDRGPKALERFLTKLSELSPDVKALLKSLPLQVFHSIKLKNILK